ncbi:MAG: helix-hairpin-helix domain-containing protein, partial [Planctomycetota bacterium]
FLPGSPDANGCPEWQLPVVTDGPAQLRTRCLDGARCRYGDPLPADAQARLEHELAIISRKGFSGYILIVADLCAGRRTCGRGSAASSIVCYCLGITHVDPLRYNLVFERFLSDARFDPPDIDVDFPWDERDAVSQAAIARHGRDHVAWVSTHQHTGGRGALRLAAGLHGQGRSQVSSEIRARRVAEAHGGYQAASTGYHAVSADWATIDADAAALHGLPRHCGLHCGGVVITRAPVRELVPVHPARKQLNGAPLPAIAWEKDGAEAMGLVKIDLLGNRSLAVIRDVLADLREDGITIDEDRWHPQDDPLARRLIERGLTIGCFYIESPAVRLLNRRAGRVDFDRLVVHSSIIRPAANRWINTYLKRLHYADHHDRHDEAWYPHPALRKLLADSFGIVSYQEDVMLLGRDLAGFDDAQQSTLRKALGKADTSQRLRQLAGAFRAGCRARGVSTKVVELVWDMIESFAGYSFCKAHSASYAMVSYQCACLKLHNPAHFLARVIANEGGYYDRSTYVEEARRFHVKILSPCVLRSAWTTRREHAGAIRLGLHCVRGLARRIGEAIVAHQRQRTNTGIAELLTQVAVPHDQLLALDDAGAFDRLLANWSPGQRRWLLLAWHQRLHGHHHNQPGQIRIAGIDSDLIPPADVPEPDQRQRDQRTWATLGCLPRCHPLLALFADSKPGRHSCRDIHPGNDGRRLSVRAWVITSKAVNSTQRR